MSISSYIVGYVLTILIVSIRLYTTCVKSKINLKDYNDDHYTHNSNPKFIEQKYLESWILLFLKIIMMPGHLI